MTHTLHRLGSARSLRGDYVVLAIASQTVKTRGSALTFRKFADIVLKYDPLNFGDMKTGNTFKLDADTIQAGYCDNSIVHAVFRDGETVANVLRDLKEADLGLSIVVSGLLDQTAQCCRAAGLEPHTVQYALGIFGKTDLLPRPWILEVSTMCGHGMVTFALIEELADRLQHRMITVEEAARELAGQCYCGVFNPDRAMRILRKMVQQEKNRDGHNV